MKRLIFMVLGKLKPQQDELFIPTAKLATRPGHPFYRKVNEVLAEAGFDDFAERLCAKYCEDGGRLGIPPRVYFRRLFVGYFEGLDSQRGIAWHCADSLGLCGAFGHRDDGGHPGARFHDHHPATIAGIGLPRNLCLRAEIARTEWTVAREGCGD